MRKPFNYAEAVAAFREDILRRNLAQAKGNACLTARLLGIHRNTVTRQAKTLGINLKDYRSSHANEA